MKNIFLILIIIITVIDPAFSQSLNIDLGEEGGSVTSKILQLIVVITILSLAPSILVMVTSFTRIVVVFSFLRSALGLQQTPPNTVLISLALFLTLFIMEPAFIQSYNDGIKPLIDEQISEVEAAEKAAQPFHRFMMNNVREKDLNMFLDIAVIDATSLKSPDAVPYRVVIPAFLISELRRAFEIGFLIFIPFLIIDLIVASTLMAMGMMMVPPVLISLPFKLIFFVLIDGWYLVVGTLVKSFS